MRTITIQVDEEVYRKIKMEVARQGISLKDYITSLVRKDLERKDKNE